MTRLVALNDGIVVALEAAAARVVPTLARLVFAATLLTYYLHSGWGKIGEGIAGAFQPSVSAYVTIFPRAFEAVGYDVAQLGVSHWAIALAGTWGEILLPILVVIGLLTRLAAFGMIVFVGIQSWVDVVGHGLAEADIGAWFDRLPSSVIMDQRAFWVFLLLVLVFRGGGPLSVDRMIAAARRTSGAAPAQSLDSASPR